MVVPTPPRAPIRVMTCALVGSSPPGAALVALERALQHLHGDRLGQIVGDAELDQIAIEIEVVALPDGDDAHLRRAELGQGVERLHRIFRIVDIDDRGGWARSGFAADPARPRCRLRRWRRCASAAPPRNREPLARWPGRRGRRAASARWRSVSVRHWPLLDPVPVPVFAMPAAAFAASVALFAASLFCDGLSSLPSFLSDLPSR